MAATPPSLPTFPHPPPPAYRWLVDHGLGGFAAFSSLEPWYLVPAAEAFSVSAEWPKPEHTDLALFTFARRQDSDELACFAWRDGSFAGIWVIHGWTSDGYWVADRYPTLWEWLHSVVADIEDWAALDS